MSLSTKVHALSIDPSEKSSQISLNRIQLEKANYRSIVVCGSEAANFVEQENMISGKKIISITEKERSKEIKGSLLF